MTKYINLRIPEENLEKFFNKLELPYIPARFIKDQKTYNPNSPTEEKYVSLKDGCGGSIITKNINMNAIVELRGFHIQEYQEAHNAYIEEVKREAKKEVIRGFVQRFCNDHNEKTRWLRNVSLTMDTLLDDILEYFKEQ